MSWVRCSQCGVQKAQMWIARPKGAAVSGCARGHPPDHSGMCASMRIELLQMALRRAICPDAFDANGRIKSGPDAVRAMDAERAAIRSAAAIFGPVLVGGESEPKEET